MEEAPNVAGGYLIHLSTEPTQELIKELDNRPEAFSFARLTRLYYIYAGTTNQEKK
jgi:hypothetical protein